VGNMHAKFQSSSFTGVVEVQGDMYTWDVTPDPYKKFLNSPLCFARFASGGIIEQLLQKVAEKFINHSMTPLKPSGTPSGLITDPEVFVNVYSKTLF